MGKLLTLLRGSVRLEVRGAFPERFLNLCAQSQIPFRDLERQPDGSVRLSIYWKDRKRVDELAGRALCQVVRLHQSGAPSFLRRFRRRYALWAGVLLAVGAVLFLSRFIWVVEVEGNETVPSQVIVAELAREGLRPGVYAEDLPVREMAGRALLRLEGLSWMTVNLHGIRAQVVVREATPEPERADEEVLGDIVSQAAGLITELEVWAGDGAVEVGDIVLPGEVLIRGSVEMEPPLWSELGPEWLPVRAKGRCAGRTWRTLTAQLPLSAEQICLTGEEESCWCLNFWGRRLYFCKNSGILIDRYVKIKKTWVPSWSEVLALPFYVEQEKRYGYETQPGQLDPTAATAMVQEQLDRQLLALVGETGEVLRRDFSVSEDNGVLTVTLQAECREELGRFRPAGGTDTGE